MPEQTKRQTGRDSTNRNTTPTPGRRKMLKTLAAGSGLGLAGCLGFGGSGGGSGDLADSIIVQQEGGSMLDALSIAFDQFKEEFGVEVKTALRGSQQSGYAKIKAGQSDVDMVSVPPFTLYNGVKDGLWDTIQPEEIPNYESNVMDPLKNPVFDPGPVAHGIPHAYGTVGMPYNSNHVKDPNSWGVCWDQANEGHIAMEGFGFVRVFHTALYLGMDPNDIKLDGSYEKGIEKIWDKVAEQQELVLTNWTSGNEQGRLFASGNAWAGEGWGNVIKSAAESGNDFLEYTIPQEGAYGYTQNHAIVNGISDKKRKTCLEFINFLLRDDVLKPVTEKLGLPPATTVTSKKIKNLYDYTEDVANLTMPDVEYINEHNDEWSQRWTKVRAD